MPDWTLPDDQAPLGARYETLLAEVYADLCALADAHAQHGEPNGDWCAPDGDGVCDVLGGAMYDRLTASVSPEDVEGWLADGPGDLLDWTSDLQGETPRVCIVNAIHYDLEQRLMSPVNGWPRRG